jgi:DtxR family Mn-dependent transcriptional regulator
MRAAAVEQFLRTIIDVQQADADAPSVAAIARACAIPYEQAQKATQILLERELVHIDASGGISLTAYGLRRLLTESIEDYLVTIYRLGRSHDDERVTTSAIAQALGVSAPSVTSMTQKTLTRLGLVDYERHRGVTLTPLGEQIALVILRHHRIVELFLVETLGLPWDQIHDEANRLEHAMSPMLIDRLAAMLGDPQVDPHGDPIPRKDGTITHPGLTPLDETPPGSMVVVRRVRDQSSDILRYLGEIGMVPGTSVEVVAHEPLDGPLTVRIGENQQVLGRDLARVILVAPTAAN